MKKIFVIAGILLIFILVIVIPKYLRELHSAQKKVSTYLPFTVQTPIVPIEYYRTGNGYPILISHGITGGFDQGLGLAKNYIGGEYDLIAVSRFGYLGSPIPEDSSPDAQADVYKHLLDKLNIDKTFVFGNSAGGTSAIKFAMKYPDRCMGLILVSSNVPSDGTLPPKPIMRAVFGSNFIYWSITRLLGDNMLPSVGVPKSILKDLTRQEKDVLLNEVLMGGFPISLRTKGVINDMYVSNPDINKGYTFEQIKVPVLMVCAKDDPMCPYKSALMVSKSVPEIKFVSFENGGHLILGHEKEIQGEIANFISNKVQLNKLHLNWKEKNYGKHKWKFKIKKKY